MFLSIIIPVYNAEKYIAECLDSCLEQDISRDDYEIVCVNDGSKDGSLSVLRDYEKRYNNIVVIDQENGGVCAARNAGLDRAAGDYVWFVDADDLIAPNILAELKNTVDSSNCDRLSFGIYRFGEKLTEQEKQARAEHRITANSDYYDISVWDNVIRRAYMTENDIYFKHPKLTHHEDAVLCFELGIAPNISKRIDTVCYYYRTNPASVSQGGLAVSTHVDILVEAAKILRFYYDNNIGSKKNAANRSMQYIWVCCYYAACSSKIAANEIREKLHQNSLLPIKRPAECTMKREPGLAYQGRLFDWLYVNSHRRFGYIGLRIYNRMQGYIKKARRILHINR